MKRIVKLTESDLHRIVKESVNRILMEAKEENKKNDINNLKNHSEKKNINSFKNYDDSDDEWKDTYTDKEGRRIQSKGFGSKKQWRTLNK